MSAIPPATVVRGPGSHFTSDGRPKLGFDDRAEAKRAAKRARSLHGKVRLVVYRCSECPRWHLATRKPRD